MKKSCGGQKISRGIVEKLVATVEKVDCKSDQKINRSGWIFSRGIVKNLLAVVKKFVPMVEKSRVARKSRDMVKNLIALVTNLVAARSNSLSQRSKN